MKKISSARLVLILGIAVFFLAKAYFVIAQTAAMGMARLGDDSYVHMWRAEQISDIGFTGALSGKIDPAWRGVRDIARFCRDTPKDAPADIRNRCSRVADNIAVPDVKAGASLLLYQIMRTGLPVKWSYAIYETLIAAIVAGGFAFFLTRLFGEASAGVALVPLSFLVFLPPQGLHQFVPSTLVIGLSAALLGAVAGSSDWRRYALVAVGFGFLSIVHPVAVVFAVALGPLAVLGFRPLRNPKGMTLTLLCAAVAFIVLIAASSVVRSVLIDAFSKDLFANLVTNLQALPHRLYRFFLANWGIVVAFAASLFWFRRLAPKAAVHVGLALLLLLAASLLHKTEFFIFSIPLDLFARIFVAFGVLCCGYLGLVITRVGWEGPIWRRAAVCVVVGLLTLPSAFNWLGTFYQNIDGRPEVIDERRLETFVETLGKGVSVAYGELNITPAAAFIAGADRLGAIPMAALPPRRLEQVMAERKPELLALPDFPLLNLLAASRSTSLERRRHGIPASAVDAVGVTPRNRTISSIYLLVENDGSALARISPVTYITTSGKQRRAGDIVIGPGERRWIETDFEDRGEVRTAIFNLPRSDLWITGVSVNRPPRAGVRWPWDSEALVQWHVRGAPRRALGGIPFQLGLLLRQWGWRRLPPSLPLGEVVSDESGIVFVETAYRKSR